MITLSRDDLRAVVAEARLAPSVHNIQPSLWRGHDDGIDLLGNPRRSIPVADPLWRDWRLSHGAALEGLALALARRGLVIADLEMLAPERLSLDGATHVIARIRMASGAPPAVAEPVTTRASWRGAFLAHDAAADAGLNQLALRRDDLTLVRGQTALANVAELADRAGLFFLRDGAHRRELLEWLRLSRRHPLYERDGLSAEAMALGAMEAWGAGMVLGPLFRTLDRVGLAAPLVSERGKTRSASAVVLFHRPDGEDPFVSGRAFYRAWLEMERVGLKGCPMSVLADWPVARDALAATYGVPHGRQIVSVFRIGRPAGQPKLGRARLPVDELLI